MRIDLITLFPEMCETVLNESILGRAQKKGVLEINTHQLRDFAFDKHKRVDDTPYGGGKGMLMKAEPIALCFENICEQVGEKPYFVYMSPQGKTLTQQRLKELAEKEETLKELQSELLLPQYQSSYSKLTEIQSQIDAMEEEIMAAMEVWEELSSQLEEMME